MFKKSTYCVLYLQIRRFYLVRQKGCGDLQPSKFWLSVRPGQPKTLPDNQKYWCSCPTDNHKFWRPSCETQPQQLPMFHVRTTRYCTLVVRGTTIYFSLNSNTAIAILRTLVTMVKLAVLWRSQRLSGETECSFQ